MLEEDTLDFFADEEVIEKKEIKIDKYLSVLDTDEKQVVMLKIVRDLKHKEIAEILDKPLGTVLWLYNKAIKKMKKEVKDEN